MQLLPFLRTQARANRLANLRLHAAMRALPADAYAAPRTGFFPSLQKTLEHILAVDRYYVAGLLGEADMVGQWERSPRDVPFAVLVDAQAEVDARFIVHLDAIDADALDAVVALDRGEGRVQRERRGHVVGHLLAHQVHHRGQAHAMLSGTPVAPPQLDEFLMPSEAALREREMASLGWRERDLFAEAA